MQVRATFIAPSNIAFIKYWGTKDADRVVPHNPSISMTLRNCVSKCTVSYDSSGTADQIFFRDQTGSLSRAEPSFARPVERHLDQLRRRCGTGGSFVVRTENSFPTGAGIASSASGFAALTLAALKALDSSPKNANEASSLARRSGSGSAARSVLGGYVRWPPSSGDPERVEQLAKASHWDLRDVVAIVDESHKGVSSRAGHERAPTSPRFSPRLKDLPERLTRVADAIRKRDIEKLGEVIETEAIDLHHVAMSSRPPIYYWNAGTLETLWTVRSLRRQGIPVYATIDAGPNVHAICPAEVEPAVNDALAALPTVRRTLRDGVGDGPYETSEHLEAPESPELIEPVEPA